MKALNRMCLPSLEIGARNAKAMTSAPSQGAASEFCGALGDRNDHGAALLNLKGIA